MNSPAIFSSIALRLPLALLFICGLVVGLSLIAIHGLTKARTEVASYASTAFTSLASASTISRQISSMLATAPFLINTTSPYRLSSESLAIAREIEALMRYMRSQPPEVFAELGQADQGRSALRLLSTLRSETLALAATANEAQEYKSLVAANIAVIDAQRKNADDALRSNAEFYRIALSAASSENLLYLGETRRGFLKVADGAGRIGLPGEAANGRGGIIAISDELFENRKQYLSRVFTIRATIARLNVAARELSTLTDAYTGRVGRILSTGFTSTTQTLAYLRATILAALLLVVILSAFAICSVIRISRAIIRISDSMNQLARGEKDAAAPRFDGAEAELHKLVHAFAAFKSSVDRVSTLHSTARAAARTIRSTFRSMNEGIAIFDSTGRPITMNRRMIDLTQAGASARRLNARYFVGRIKELDPNLLPNGETDAGTLRAPIAIRSRSIAGRVLEISVSRQPGERIVILVRDVTAADKQEAAARRAQRLDGIMRMTHQVSHEVGNMIGIISGSLGMLEKNGVLDTGQQRHVARMRKAAERGKVLASSMLSIARQQPLTPKETDLGSLLRGIHDILEMATGPRCPVRLNLPNSLPLAYLDPAPFEHAVLNLCLNAAAAMPEGGEIVVAARACEEMLAIEVRDSGSGMSPEVVDRAFEPYFTTRSNQGGTGLGLAIVYGFVRQSGGQVTIQSRPGEGTTVEMLFPIRIRDRSAVHLHQ